VAATLFSTQFLREPPAALQVGLASVLAIAVGLLAANLGVLAGVIAVITLLVAYISGGIWLVHAWGWLLPISAPLAASAVPFVGALATRVTFEQRQARGLRLALAAVLPPSVAREISRDPDRVRFGGERRTISVLFADLIGFTSFAERVDPELLSRVITEYLDAMTRVAFRHGGTVDKFIGDAVMVLWNAPLDDPQHAQNACAAALEMQTALADLSDRWQAEGLARQHMRIGIHTGPASVGNMGTSQRFAYTALGDTVNLAARLEPLNNRYGTEICVSLATVEAAGGTERLGVRFLDRVEVKGRSEPVAVYELIGGQRYEEAA
jgi:adenylate cyclase